MWASLVGQLLTCFIALVSLWKDWEDYGGLSRRFGRKLPGLLALATLLITAATVWQTSHDGRASENRDALNAGRIQELGTQLRSSDENADRRTKQLADSFQSTLGSLYNRLSDLEMEVRTEPLLRQNQVLLNEVQKTRDEVEAARATLQQPRKLADLQATFSAEVEKLDLSEATAYRRLDGTLQFTINVVNPTDVQAKNGSIYLRLCQYCTYAEEPQTFSKACGCGRL
jgi:hypothetical protein